jgi:hypothetical protein
MLLFINPSPLEGRGKVRVITITFWRGFQGEEFPLNILFVKQDIFSLIRYFLGEVSGDTSP